MDLKIKLEFQLQILILVHPFILFIKWITYNIIFIRVLWAIYTRRAPLVCTCLGDSRDYLKPETMARYPFWLKGERSIMVSSRFGLNLN